MSKVLGRIEINFDTAETITKDQLRELRKKLNKISEIVDDMAEELGIDIVDVYPAMMEYLEVDGDDEENETL
jgi:predicted regulator of amino acid metabolism with ACT domain